MAKDSSFPKELKAIYSWNCTWTSIPRVQGSKLSLIPRNPKLSIRENESQGDIGVQKPIMNGFLAQGGPAMGQLSHNVTSS